MTDPTPSPALTSERIRELRQKVLDNDWSDVVDRATLLSLLDAASEREKLLSKINHEAMDHQQTLDYANGLAAKLAAVEKERDRLRSFHGSLTLLESERDAAEAQCAQEQRAANAAEMECEEMKARLQRAEAEVGRMKEAITGIKTAMDKLYYDINKLPTKNQVRQLCESLNEVCRQALSDGREGEAS